MLLTKEVSALDELRKLMFDISSLYVDVDCIRGEIKRHHYFLFCRHRCWWLIWPIQNDAKNLKND